MTTANDYKFKPSEIIIDAALDRAAEIFGKLMAFLIGEAPATAALAE